jgi:hypothetical protein
LLYTELYHDYRGKIYVSKSSHWRETPSTTQSFAVLNWQLKKDWDLHLHYSTLPNSTTTEDHNKFLKLGSLGIPLISSIPGYSTHCQQEWVSPVIDWTNI